MRNRDVDRRGLTHPLRFQMKDALARGARVLFVGGLVHRFLWQCLEWNRLVLEERRWITTCEWCAKEINLEKGIDDRFGTLFNVLSPR